MDVQCERCKTEYEFDDALVSGRGTTVRCTTCGHQFKVHMAGPGGSEPPQDKWVVQLSGGSRVTYLTLRELQRAIVARQVSRNDTLLRGEAPPRRLGAIAELEPFFDGRASTRPPSAPIGHEAQPAPHVPPAGPLPSFSRAPESRVSPPSSLNPGQRPAWEITSNAPSVPRKPTPLGFSAPAGAAAPPPPPSAQVPPMRPRTISRPAEFDIEAGPAPISIPANEYAMIPDSAPTPPRGASRSQPPPPSLQPADPYAFSDPAVRDPMAEAMRGVRPSYPSDPVGLPQRRKGGWVAAGILLVGVAAIGALVVRARVTAKPDVAPANPKAIELAKEGEAALAEGDLDRAEHALDKASVLVEGDPHIAVDVARVAVAAADLLWLRLRSLPPDATDDLRTTRQQLGDRLARARKAVDDALAVAPNDVSAVRAKVDLLRMADEKEAAKIAMTRLSGSASQPETAYTEATLELTETAPAYARVIEKLRAAATAEGSAGRARAALVYALAQSGDSAAAAIELSKLEALPRSHPLLGLLRGMLAKSKRKPDAGVAATKNDVTSVADLPPGGGATPPPVPANAGGGGGAPAGGGTVAIPGDPAAILQQAEAAKRKRDWARARQLYDALLERNPTDSEALAGQADMDRAQGNPGAAIAGYKRAISVNPSYIPALVGLADALWETGDRASATKKYKEIEERFPEGSYPALVKTRAEPPPAPAEAPTDPSPPKEKEKPVPKPAASHGDETP